MKCDYCHTINKHDDGSCDKCGAPLAAVNKRAEPIKTYWGINPLFDGWTAEELNEFAEKYRLSYPYNFDWGWRR